MGKPFKMKGHTLPGINQRSEGDTDLPDGRSASAALQYNSPAKKTPSEDKSRDWAAIYKKASEKGSGATKEQIADLKQKADTQKSAQEYVIKEDSKSTKEGVETIERFRSGEQAHTT